MKYFRLLMVLLLLVMVIVSGCAQIGEDGAGSNSGQKTDEQLSDEQLLQQNPDYLDEALQELDEVE